MWFPRETEARFRIKLAAHAYNRPTRPVYSEEETEAQELGHVPKVVRRWF